MGKKVVTTLNLDEDVLNVAKKTFPNISKTVNEILKEMLELNTVEKINLVTQLKITEERIQEDKKKIASIHQLLNTTNSISSEEIEYKEQERIWIRCVGEARNNMELHYKIEENTLNTAESVLKLSKETIKKLAEEVVDDIYLNQIDITDSQSWKFIKEHYLTGDD